MIKPRSAILLLSVPFIGLISSGWGIWSPVHREMLREASHETVPITFYGKVTDINGVAISGAEIHLQEMKVNWGFLFWGNSPREGVMYELRSDALGRFGLENVKGESVIIFSIDKEGYKFKPRDLGGGNIDTGFYYAGAGVGRGGPHRADANHPVTFEMEPLNAK